MRKRYAGNFFWLSPLKKDNPAGVAACKLRAAGFSAAVVGALILACPPAWAEGPGTLERIERLERTLAEQQRLIEAQQRRLDEQARTIETQRRQIEALKAEVSQAAKATEAAGKTPPAPGTAAPASASQTVAAKAARRAAARRPPLPGTFKPHGDTVASGLLERFDLAIGIQYRLMYNASNLPGPAGTTVSKTRSYDFLRQRLRLNFDLAPKGIAAGGFLQAEFRGGIGGSSPAVSDPRGRAPSLNPFNRLQARGIRYGFLYLEPAAGHSVLAGILPLSDEFDDTLFSADWDFNVGGLALLGSRGPFDYRLAVLRLVEGVGSTDTESLGKDGDFLLADLTWRSAEPKAERSTELGLHLYYLDIGKGLPLGATEELWAGTTARWQPCPETSLRAFALVNTGRLGIGELDQEGRVLSGFERGDAHTGYAFKLEGSGLLAGRARLAAQAIYATGDRQDGPIRHRFVTPEGLFGTEGYWAYTHLLTANGPSDVGDLGLEIGAGGAGLLTLQSRLEVPLGTRLRAQVFSGWFRADRKRSGSRSIATEIGAMATAALAEGLHLDLGVARAFLGDFFGPGADDLYEVFSRLQLQY